MGTWGPGLYSDDFALDLRSTISGVCRLPIDGPEIVALMTDLHPVALDPGDEDCGTFWLVLADQLQRRGIASGAQAEALSIIDTGSNLELLADLGMDSINLRKRRGNLEKLRDRLLQPLADKRRVTLKKPQALLMDQGQVYVFPVDSRGNCVNPYFTDKDRPEFIPAGWSAFLVVNAGHALEYLAWYQLAVSRSVTKRRPTLRRATRAIDPARSGLGTVTRLHASRMELELLGSADVAIAPAPSDSRTISTAASDISISNVLSRWKKPGTFP